MSSRGSYTTTTNILLLMFLSSCSQIGIQADECQLTPVIHVLQYPGCIPKPIPSFACTGRCTSYVQVKSFISFALMDWCTIISSAKIRCYVGFWIKTVANGTILYVLSGERRTRSYSVSVMSESSTGRTQTSTGNKILITFCSCALNKCHYSC